MKNDNIHSFFSLFWLQILNLPASLQNKNTRIGPFPWKRSVLQNPDRERTNQSTGIRLRLGLPYNNQVYSPPRIKQRAKLQKSIIFQFIVTGKVVIGAIFSNCVVYTKTIIHLGVGETCGYLPPL